ncbi:MAG: type VI secretion protein IcmF/TssM N-terminal domain-containing protein, partial [Candidatus Acidiferrum sp.]
PLSMAELGQMEQLRPIFGPPEAAVPGQSVLKNREYVVTYGARLRHLCRLIERDRAPRCPANGILLLLPLKGIGEPNMPLERNQAALDTGVICHADLTAICEVFRLHIPMIGLLCDLDRIAGSEEFLSRFSTGERAQSRIGQRAPLVPRFQAARPGAADNDRRRNMLDSLAAWVSGPMIMRWVYRSFKVESNVPPGLELATVEKHNGKLFQFFVDIDSRKQGLALTLKETLIGPAEAARPLLPLLFGGLYMGWTGRHSAFYSAVLERLLDEEDNVRWSDEVFAEEGSLQRRVTWARIGLGGLILANILAIAGVVWIFNR